MARVKITLVRSPIGCPPKQVATVRGLGLRRMGSTVVQEASLPILGMIRRVAHLVEIQEVQEEG